MAASLGPMATQSLRMYYVFLITAVCTFCRCYFALEYIVFLGVLA